MRASSRQTIRTAFALMPIRLSGTPTWETSVACACVKGERCCKQSSLIVAASRVCLAVLTVRRCSSWRPSGKVPRLWPMGHGQARSSRFERLHRTPDGRNWRRSADKYRRLFASRACEVLELFSRTAFFSGWRYFVSCVHAQRWGLICHVVQSSWYGQRYAGRWSTVA